MTPLKVTAHIAEPIIDYGDGMHLDGLLAYAKFRQRQRAGEEFPDPNHVDWPTDFDLPLSRWQAPLAGECHARLLDSNGKLWGWHASDIQWPDYAIEGSVALRKMTDQDQMVRGTDAGSLKSSTGLLKNRDKTYPTRQARRVWWWAYGDASRVRALLKEVTHVGKLHGHGQGRVQSWEVEEAAVDRSLIDKSTLMRRMPASAVEATRPPVRGTIRAPYWHTSRQCDTYPAGTEVEHVDI